MSGGIQVPPITGPGAYSGPVVVQIWQASTPYPQGSFVYPTAAAPAPGGSLPNSQFELGTLSGWTGTGWTVGIGDAILTGANSAHLTAGAGSNLPLISNTKFPVIPGQQMTCGTYTDSAASDTSQPACIYACIFWYNSSNVLIGQTALSDTYSQSFPSRAGFPPPGQSWPLYWMTEVIGTAPAGAAYASPGVVGKNTSGVDVQINGITWLYSVQGTAFPIGYTAIQVGTGTSGTTEPTWPTSGTVNDGTVVWQQGATSIIKWLTVNISTSGTTEPTWPTTIGANYLDGTVMWQTITPAVYDKFCPQSKYVVAGSSKIFAGDNDIVRYSATTNPMDWTSEADAGYLPTGLQNYGANSVGAVGLYRSNLVVFNAQGLQMWQIDEDPANMSLLDAIPVGSTFQKALAPVNNDLFFLSPQGVRTMGISAASSNLMAGDVGMPVDPIVQAAIAWANANGVDPIATYYPSAGQYWLAFPGWPDSGFFLNPGSSNATNVFVYTMNRAGAVGAWSRYLFPFLIEAFCQNGNDLYIRCNTVGQTGSDIVKVDPTALQDFASDTHGRTAYFTGVVQWPWLDFGTTGTTKKFEGVDVVATATGGNLSISVGYDQSTTSRMTTPYAIGIDTLPGNFIPIALMAPSFSVQLTFSSQYQWQIQAVNVYLQDQRLTA